MKIKMKQKESLHSNSWCHFVYVITFLWFIICVYKSQVFCLSLKSESKTASDLIQGNLGNKHSQNQHAGTTDKTNPNKNQSQSSDSAQVEFLTQENQTETEIETENESKCEDELTPEVCRNFVQNNICEQKGNPNVPLCQRSCKVCEETGVGDKENTVDSKENSQEEETQPQPQNVYDSENWDRKKDENNKDCFDLFPNCTCRNVSNIVTCCNWINAQNLNNIPCRKSCGICGGNGVFANKPPEQGSRSNGNGQAKNINMNDTNDTKGQTSKNNNNAHAEYRKNPSGPNFDAFCKPNPNFPIIEPQPANPNNPNNNNLMPFFPIGNQNGGTPNMC